MQALDIFLPDANSDYYLGGFGTKDGARTVITGKVPTARYWSFMAYPLPATNPVTHVHDTHIAQTHGRYKVTISASCAGITGTCLATTKAEQAGIVVLRLYVPVDLNGAGTGGVPLPTLSYSNAAGSPISLATAAGSKAIGNQLASYQGEHGALPSCTDADLPARCPRSRQLSTASAQGRYLTRCRQVQQSRQHLRARPLLDHAGQSRRIGPGPDLPSRFVPVGQRAGPAGEGVPPGSLLVPVHRAQGSPYR